MNKPKPKKNMSTQDPGTDPADDSQEQDYIDIALSDTEFDDYSQLPQVQPESFLMSLEEAGGQPLTEDDFITLPVDDQTELE